jgi:hypothetical protein
VSHRRIRLDEHGHPVVGLYDTVLDVRLKELLDAVRGAGVEVQTRSLVGHDGILVAREIAEAVVKALARRIGQDDRATDYEMGLLNRLLTGSGRGSGLGNARPFA